ncbi:ribokinase [Leifsonia sp. L25]|uniref:ribokinase n=1 Tax=Actinomycetes TaxID=1760 RepID=UPI003D68556D
MRTEPASPRVTVLGSYAKAIVITADRIPLAGETVLGRDYRQEFGGKGSDMAVQAARLGARTTFVGVVGTDALGAEFLELMRDEGVDTTAVRTTSERSTGVGLIVKDEEGRNVIVVDLGANELFSPDDVVAAGGRVTDAAVVLAPLEIPLPTALHGLSRAHAAGAVTILNPAPAARLTGPLEGIDVLTPNQTEARVLVGRDPHTDVDNAVIADELRALGVENVVITRGEEGVDVFTPDGYLHVLAHVVDVVDSNGAGDSFSAALAVGLAEGRTLPEAVVFANAAAALCCERWETVPSYRDRAAVEALLASTAVTA